VRVRKAREDMSGQCAKRQSFSETDWDKIIHHYDLSVSIAPSAILELNRAVAIAGAKGPAEALAILQHMLPPTWLAMSYMWSAVLADLHFRNGSPELASQYVAKAYETAPSAAIRELLGRRFEPYTRGRRVD